jgi:hypothetical protein
MEDQSLPVNHPDQSYVCEGSGLLDDPFEGEIFTFWLQFFGGLTDADKQSLWEFKRPQLVSVDYKMGKLGPITVQKGLWQPNATKKKTSNLLNRVLVLQPRDLESNADALL